MPNLWDEILAERYHQDLEHGGPDHDDTLSVADWTSLLARFAGMVYACDRIGRPDLCRARLVQVAAIAVAALESWDRLHAPPVASFEELRAGPDVPATACLTGG